MFVSVTRRFCVYTHSLDGKVFYVGQGLASRAFGATHRSLGWRTKVGDHGFHVEILGWHATVSEALRSEQAAIKRLSPECNQMHNGLLRTAKQKSAISAANKGRKHSDETKRIISEKRLDAILRGCCAGKPKRPVRCVETGQTFSSVAEAAASLGIGSAHISTQLAGGRRHVGGLTFVAALAGSGKPI